MPLEENPYTVPHLKALNSGQKLWGGQRCGSTLSLWNALLNISNLLHRSRSQRFILNAFVCTCWLTNFNYRFLHSHLIYFNSWSMFTSILISFVIMSCTVTVESFWSKTNMPKCHLLQEIRQISKHFWPSYCYKSVLLHENHSKVFW